MARPTFFPPAQAITPTHPDSSCRSQACSFSIQTEPADEMAGPFVDAEDRIHGEGVVTVISSSEVHAAADQLGPDDSRYPSVSVLRGESVSSPPATTTHDINLTTTDDNNLRRLLLLARTQHARLPGIRLVPLPALGIIASVALINIVLWIAVGIILQFHTALVSTALLAYTFGLRHALDADHISAIDLMTRRLIASGQRPVTVGTFFSLGHSTIVIVTAIAVAATAAAVESKFNGFGTVGGIIGTAVSAAFLIVLGIMNAYILYRLVKQMKKVQNLRDGEEEQMWKIEGGGCLFSVLKRMFKIIDKPWKMYPLGVLFGLGFDTSSEIALLGISSIQATTGTSIWLILIFPLLFTAGMCLIDTMDGALMLTVYILPTEKFVDGDDGAPLISSEAKANSACTEDGLLQGLGSVDESSAMARRAKDPVAFLYYSIVLTTLTVVVALIIGTIQLLTLILNVANPTGPFWEGVQTAGDYYDVIGGAICGSFIVLGGLSVLCYKPWRQRMEKAKRERALVLAEADEKGLETGDGLSRSTTIVPPEGN